ncbi:MAG: class I poly(R)-hydroxyalkanoic acid synthase, partial [Acetobacteraceae bacterium]
MADTEKPTGPAYRLPDPALIGRSMADVAERSQRIVSEWLQRQSGADQPFDPLNIGRAFFEMTTRLISSPAELMQAQIGFWQDYMTLWQNTAR